MAYESKLIEEEKERLRDVGQKAGDKVDSLSFVPRNDFLTYGSARRIVGSYP